MIFTDTLAFASTPRQLFDLVLARCFRGACCTELHRLDGLSWTQFMQVYALVSERIENVIGLTGTPCLCVPTFIMQHPDKPDQEATYAICSFPRQRAFVIVSTDMFWRVFGTGAETMRLILECTPTPTVPVVGALVPFAGMWNISQETACTQGVYVNSWSMPSPDSFVHELVNARRKELGLPELSTS